MYTTNQSYQNKILSQNQHYSPSCKAVFLFIGRGCPSTGTTPTCPPEATTAAPQTTRQPDVTTKITPTAMTSTTPVPPVLDVRLPSSLDPLLYTVELQPHMYAPMQPEEFTFNGSVVILIHCKMATRNVTLHSNKLNISGKDKLKKPIFLFKVPIVLRMTTPSSMAASRFKYNT